MTALAVKTGRVTYETLSTEESFAEVAEPWDALVRAMPRPSPFLLHGWLREWWRHYGEGCTLAVHTAYRGGALVGALPLLIHSRRGLKIATFLGARQAALADLLLAEGEDPAVAEELVARAASSGQDYADLFGLAADSRLATVLGPGLHLFERIDAPVLDMSAGWKETYRAKTNSEKRRFHRRRRRQLAALGKVEVSVARTPAELEIAIEEAFGLHALRWKDRPEPDGSGFITPTGRRFNRAALLALAEIDVPRIVTLKLDGRAIAFHYYLALDERMYLHRIAFDPAFGRFSPGLVNTLDALEIGSAEGRTFVEFMGGADRYKVELADRFEPLHIGLGLPGSAAGRAALAGRTRWLRLRRGLRRSATAQRLYYGITPARRLIMRPKDVMRPSGMRRAGE